MINIAAVVSSLGPSQKSFYLVKEFNKARENTDISTSVFYERPSIPVTAPLFSCRNVGFFSDYEGIAIATTLSEANTLIKTHNNAVKCLYLWDMEWLINPVNYRPACDILHDHKLHLFARSESHAALIKNFCNKDSAAIIDDWNLDQITDFYLDHLQKEKEKEDRRQERLKLRREKAQQQKEQQKQHVTN